MSINLLADGSFETDPALTGWTKTNGPLTHHTDGGSHGTRRMKWTTINTSATTLTSPLRPCVPGTTVSVGLDVKQAALGGSWVIRIAWFDKDGAAMAMPSTSAELPITLTGSYQRFTLSATVRDDSLYFALQLRRMGAGATIGDAVDVDAVVLTPGTYTGPYVESTARPNILMIQLDDTSKNVVRHMSRWRAAQDRGLNFDRHVLTTPVCGPSRASTLAGKAPHNTGVLGNQWPEGGHDTFMAAGNEPFTIGTYLQSAGYRTGLMGKYLNGWKPDGNSDPDQGEIYPAMYVPVGWDHWYVVSDGYDHFDWVGVEQVDGDQASISAAGDAEANYFTDVLADEAANFISDAHAADPTRPWCLLVNPFATHGGLGADPEDPGGPRFPAAPRDRPDGPNRPNHWAPPEFPVHGDLGTFGPDVPWPDPDYGNFNKQPAGKPAWHKDEVLPQSDLDDCEENHLDRIRMAQSVNDLIDQLEDLLQSLGIKGRTILVFTCDNGFHLGEHALKNGKGSPYEHDVSVPLVIVPPTQQVGGVEFPAPGGGSTELLTQNIDLLPTFMSVAELLPPTSLDGRSLIGFLQGGEPTPWRVTAWSQYSTNGSWNTHLGSGDAPKWVGMFGERHKYVDYAHDGFVPASDRGEVYDLRNDPAELSNLWSITTSAQKNALNAHLQDYWTSAGVAFWANALIPLDGPAATAGRAEGLYLDGELIVCARFSIGNWASTMGWPPRRGDNDAIAHIDGRAWRPDKPYDQNTVPLQFWALGADKDGNVPEDGSGDLLIRDNLDELGRLFHSHTDGELHSLLRVYSDGSQREALIEVASAVDMTAIGSRAAKFVVDAVIPGGFWRTPAPVSQTLDYDFDQDGTLVFTNFDGTAPSPDLTIILHGKFDEPRLTCHVSGASAIQFTQDVNTGQNLILDCGAWSALKEIDPGVFEDVSHLIERHKGKGPWLRFTPRPKDGAISVRFNLAGAPGPGSTVTLEGYPRYLGA